MSGAETFISAVRDSVFGGPNPVRVAVGRVSVTPAANDRAAVAEVQGITAESSIYVTPESWAQPFQASVAAGSVTGRLVVVLFNEGQPIILCLIGVM